MFETLRISVSHCFALISNQKQPPEVFLEGAYIEKNHPEKVKVSVKGDLTL